MQINQIRKNEILLLAYKDLIASFFTKHYPDVNPDQFWGWFLETTMKKNIDISNLNPSDLNEFLNQVTVLGDNLFHYKS